MTLTLSSTSRCSRSYQDTIHVYVYTYTSYDFSVEQHKQMKQIISWYDIRICIHLRVRCVCNFFMLCCSMLLSWYIYVYRVMIWSAPLSYDIYVYRIMIWCASSAIRCVVRYTCRCVVRYTCISFDFLHDIRIYHMIYVCIIRFNAVFGHLLVWLNVDYNIHAI